MNILASITADPSDQLLKFREERSLFINVAQRNNIDVFHSRFTNLQAALQNSPLSQKCQKIINLISNSIKFPTLSILINGEWKEKSTLLLAKHSSFIRKLINEYQSWKNESENPIKLDLSQFDHEIIDEIMNFFAFDEPNQLQTKNLFEIAHLADYLQSKKLSRICAKKFMNELSNYSFKNLDDAEHIITFLNFAADKPAFKGLTNKLEKEVSWFIRKALDENNDLLFERLELLKNGLKVPITLDFSHSFITEKQLQLLADFPLRGLGLANCDNLTPEIFNIFKTMKWYESLKLLDLSGNSFINTDACQEIAKMPQLKELYLCGCKNLQDSGVQKLPLTLEKLNVSSNPNIGELSCKRFNEMSLIELDISYCTNLKDENISLLPLTLEILEANGNPHIGQLSCQRINQMTALHTLKLNGCPLTEENIQLFPITLKSLGMNNNPHIGRQSCMHFGRMIRLKELTMSNCPGVKDTDAQLLPLSLESINIGFNPNISRLSCKRFGQMLLKFVCLQKCSSLTDGDIYELPITLEKINLSDNLNIGNLSCQRFSNMENLKELYLDNCKTIRDEQVRRLPWHLETLSMKNLSLITPNCLSRLGDMTSLKYLNLEGYRKVLLEDHYINLPRIYEGDIKILNGKLEKCTIYFY